MNHQVNVGGIYRKESMTAGKTLYAKIMLAVAAGVACVCSAATTYNLSNGNVTVPDNTTATITQSNPNKPLANKMTIGTNCTVTLTGVNIVYGEAVDLGSGSTLILNGASLGGGGGDKYDCVQRQSDNRHC